MSVSHRRLCARHHPPASACGRAGRSALLRSLTGRDARSRQPLPAVTRLVRKNWLESQHGGGRAFGPTNLRAPRLMGHSDYSACGPAGQAGPRRNRIRIEPPRCTHARARISIRGMTELNAFTRPCASEASALPLVRFEKSVPAIGSKFSVNLWPIIIIELLA